MSALVPVAVFALLAGLGLLWYQRRSRRRALGVLMDIMRELARVAARDPTFGDSELLDVSGGFVVLRLGADTVRIPAEKLVRIHLEHAPEQRDWHYGRALAEAQRAARE